MGTEDVARTFSREALDLIAEQFKLLAEPMRLMLLQSLREGPKSVSQLVEEIGASQANVSKHLGLLYRAHMVDRQKDGLHVHYFISDPNLFQLCELMCARVEADLDARRRALSP